MCVSEAFWIGGTERKGSFEEVTDEAQATGQRKFAWWWYRATERNFSPLSTSGTVDRGRTDPAAVGAFVSSPHEQYWGITWGREKTGVAVEFHSRNQAPLFLLFPAPPPVFFLGFAMGKEQELLEAARTGNLATVEKLLSGKRQSAGTGSGLYGTGGSGNSGGHGASSHPLSSLLR